MRGFCTGLAVVVGTVLCSSATLRAQTIADSVAEWSGSGTQGAGGWFYGYYNLTADANGVYAPGDLTLFTAASWTGSQYDLLAASAGPWTEIGQESTHPNGTNSNPGEEHWTIRRWVSDYSGPVAITWHMRKSNTGGGNGVEGILFVEGVEVDSAVIAGSDGVGVERSVVVTVSNGSRVDLALTPNGSDGSDGSSNWMRVSTDLSTIPDEDSDGVFDSQDNCVSVPNADQANSDGDELGNACDNCPSVSNPDQRDGDGNGIGDACEDSDGDGVGDANDNCVSVPNANQADSDNDDVGNVCDNCPSVVNRLQRDLDEDGIGDACDPDTPGSTSGPFPIHINEIHFNPSEGEEFEFLELFNSSNQPVNIGLWSFDAGLSFVFPVGTTVPANGFLVVCPHPDVIAAYHGLVEADLVWSEGTRLANDGENVVLVDVLGIEVDRIRFDDELPWDPLADGLGSSLQRLCAAFDATTPANWLAAPPTPLAPSITVECPPAPLPAPAIAINEVYYHPPNDQDELYEYIELVNTTGGTIDLDGYSFSRGIDFTFSEPTPLGPGQFLVVCRNESAVRSRFGITNTAGNWTGQLSNSGERLTLLDASGDFVDSFRYDDSGDWSPAADGLGASLEKINPRADSSSPVSWLDSGAADPGGDPGADWVTVSVEGNATSSRLYFFIAGAGEFLIDDVSLVEVGDPGTNLLPGFGFPTGIAPYEGVGNHSSSRWSQAAGGPVFDEAALHLVATGTGTGSSNSVRVDALEALDLDPATRYRLTFSYLHISGSRDLIARLSVSTPSNGIYWELGAVINGAATPGVANNAFRSELPPLVSHINRWPLEPDSSVQPWIFARVRGAAASVRLTANLTTGTQELVMRDDGASNDGVAGDGIYGVRLPAQPHDTAVTFSIRAVAPGGAARETPLVTDPRELHGYYVNDNQPSTNIPVFHFLVPSSDPRGWISSRSCSTYSTISFAFRGDLYYNVGLRRRGGSVCGSGKPYLKVRFHKGQEFRFDEHPPHKNLNFQSLYTDKSLVRENLAWEFVFREMGRAYCSHDFVRIHSNGDYFGLYAAMERPDERFLERNGLDPDGSLYKATASREERNGTYEKKTNETTGDADLRDFLNDMHDTPSAGLVSFFQTRSDEDAIIDYQLCQILINNSDYPHKNHYLYHDITRGKWRVTGWDLDLSYGKLWDGGNGGVFNDRMHNPGITPWYTTSVRGGGAGNYLLDKFFSEAGTYYRRAYIVRLFDAIQEKYRLDLYDERLDYFRALLYEEQFDDIDEWGRTGPFGDSSAPPGFEANIERVREHISIRRQYLLDYLRSTEGFTGHDRLKITEVMYNPFGDDDAEFLELWNGSGKAVDISGWRIEGIGGTDVAYVFPASTVVPDGEVFVVAKDPGRFAAIYGDVGRVFGPYPGNLDNEGEVLRVKDDGPGFPATVDYLRYDTHGEWPAAANGLGFSMEMVSVAVDQDNDWGHAWRASPVPGGTPGSIAGITPGLTYFRRADPNADGYPDVSDALFILFYAFGDGRTPSCLQSADVDASGAIDVTDALSLLNFLFLRGVAPATPFGACGPADDASPLSCDAYAPCLSP